MKTFGLTGGIGMGKSTVARWLAHRGLPVVDTDQLAHQLVEPGYPALAEIQKRFGAEIIAPGGKLRRDELARRVFADDIARRQLEDILHPRIRELWLAQIETWRMADRSTAVVVIPLLFETDASSRFDQTICVACSAAAQRERLLARGWTLEQIEQRIRAQWPVERKMELSDHVVWTEGGLDSLAAQLSRIFPL